MYDESVKQHTINQSAAMRIHLRNYELLFAVCFCMLVLCSAVERKSDPKTPMEFYNLTQTAQLLLNISGIDMPLVDMNVGQNKIRNVSFTWEENRKIVESNGHKWCSYLRDNWACVGETYAKVLRNTPPLDHAYRFDRIFDNPENPVHIYVEGNSMMGQVITAWLCASEVTVYKYPLVNSLYAVAESGSSLFLLCNDAFGTEPPHRLFELLKLAHFQPHIVILGRFNSWKSSKSTYKFYSPERLAVMHAHFRNASIKLHSRYHVGRNCGADFKNCDLSGSHQCIPGPIYSHVEQIAKDLAFEKQFINDIPM